MLDLADTLMLPTGVHVTGGLLHDDARGAVVPVNPAAALVLSGSGRRLSEIADDLAAAFSLPRERAVQDVLVFTWQLNALGLANIRRRAGPLTAGLAWLVLALRLLPAATVPPTLVRRSPLDTTSAGAAAVGAIRAVAPRAVLLGLLAAVLALVPASVAGAAALPVALVLGAGLATAVVAHEAGHAMALVPASPGAVIVAWRRISVLHGPLPPARSQLVAAAGPLLAAALGLLAAAVAAVLGAPEVAIGSTPLAGHALGLTALTSDGRKACGT